MDMSRVAAFNHYVSKTALAALLAGSLGLTACGGGGGSSNSAPAASNATITLEANTSSSATINASDPDGDTLTYSVATQPTNGSIVSAGNTFTYTPNTDYSGSDAFTVTVSDPDGETATANVAVTVQDNIPDAITFAAQSGVELDALITSDTQTLAGVEVPVAISIAGGEYSLNGGAFTAEAGIINSGDTVAVQVTSSADYGTPATATLTVAGQQSNFVATTVADEQNPEAQIAFPPAVALTNDTSTIVRGMASDSLSGVVSVTVKIGSTETPATTEDNYANWQAEVELAEGENTIEIIVEDAAGNIASNAATAMLKRGDDTSFPSSNPLIKPFTRVIFDKPNNRFLMANGEGNGTIHAIDIATGATTLFSNDIIADDGLTIGEVWSIGEDPFNNRLFVFAGELENQFLYELDLATGERSLIASDMTPAGSAPILEAYPPFTVTEDTLYFFSRDYFGNILSVDLRTGANYGLVKDECRVLFNEVSPSYPVFDRESQVFYFNNLYNGSPDLEVFELGGTAFIGDAFNGDAAQCNGEPLDVDFPPPEGGGSPRSIGFSNPGLIDKPNERIIFGTSHAVLTLDISSGENFGQTGAIVDYTQDAIDDINEMYLIEQIFKDDSFLYLFDSSRFRIDGKENLRLQTIWLLDLETGERVALYRYGTTPEELD